MKIDSNKGSILIFLIAVITILSVLGAAMLSFTDTSLLSTLSLNNYNKAVYYADSGVRYTELIDSTEFNFDGKTSFTIFDNNGTLEIHSPSKIESAGFNIELTDCNIESTGIVNEDSSFEAIHTISEPFLRGLPCWRFETLTDDTLEDSCGNNRGIIIDPTPPPPPPKKISLETREAGNNSWKFNGQSYVKTLFRPYCEIGDGVSFSISFWVKPEDSVTVPQTVFGLTGFDDSENGSRLAIGITGGAIGSDKNWTWAAYGDENEISLRTVNFAQWQHIIFIFDNDDVSAKKVYFKVQNCLVPPESEILHSNLGIAGLPYTSKHMFIGAENINGSAGSHFTGEIDELEIIKYETGVPTTLIDDLSPCP